MASLPSSLFTVRYQPEFERHANNNFSLIDINLMVRPRRQDLRLRREHGTAIAVMNSS